MRDTVQDLSVVCCDLRGFTAFAAAHSSDQIIQLLREYYDANQDLFTEPARNRVSLILVGVEPSASAATWKAAREEAARVRQRLDEGTAFDELARMHSSDITAAAGGDMGFLHQVR